jgi:ADP-heptose:LPS heptosyltransferase
LIARGIVPVVVGTRGEVPLGAAIQTMAPEAIDLTGQTTLEELTELTRIAAVAIGNDTGPAHLAAAAGCATVVLFSADSDPALCAPRGRWVRTLREGDLSALPLLAVTEALPALG